MSATAHATAPAPCHLDENVSAEEVERFYLTLGGHVFFQTLRAAARLDLFTLLSREGSLTRSQIAERLHLAEQPTRILLLGLTATRMLLKDGDRYSNSRVAEVMLTRGSPKSVLAFVEYEHAIVYRAMPWFHDSLCANANVGLREFRGDEPTLYPRLAHHPELEQTFQDAMQELSLQANDALAGVDLSQVRHLVDVGGGNGSNAIVLARRYPGLRVTVFDSPSVAEMARAHVRSAGMSERIDVVAGDCFIDSFPRGADCFLFAHFFTIWSTAKNRFLLAKAQAALAPGGRTILFNMMQADGEDGPLSAAIGSPYFLTLATGEGMLYTWREYEAWMREAGFVDVERVVLPRDHGAIVGRRP
jgi:hypothetical protein